MSAVSIDKTKRVDNTLHLWIQEAKNLNPKKRYFCELCLDKRLYARTSSKQMADMLFWGEHFEFHKLPAIEKLTINIYREGDKKKKKERNTVVGYVNLSVSEISSRQVVERWYRVDSATVSKSSKESVRGGETVSIRVKARYQTVSILPLHCYTPLIQYVTSDYSPLVEALEPSVSVKQKEELARALVAVLQHSGNASSFISDTVITEVDRHDNDTLALRGNSIATKAVEAYMKLIGQKYLVDTLGDVIRNVLEPSVDVEVDPSRVTSPSVLVDNQQNLVKY